MPPASRCSRASGATCIENNRNQLVTLFFVSLFKNTVFLGALFLE